jgi:hypothetical protein
MTNGAMRMLRGSRRRPRVRTGWLLPAIAITAAANTSATAGITAEQAATLPESELARRVLGDLGALVLHVRRPAWTNFDPLPHIGPPPLQSLTFDLKAEDRWAGGWSGMCQAQRVTVSFGPSGEPVSMTANILSGTVGKLRRASSEQSLTLAPCAELKTLEGFFYSWNGPQDSDATIPAVQLIADNLANSTRLNFPLTCELQGSNVPCRQQDWRIDINDIDGIVERDCEAPELRSTKSRLHCFVVTLARGGWGSSFSFPSISFVIKDGNSGQSEVVSAHIGLGTGVMH